MHEIVIFGASGDLTRRKLIPALFSLWKKGRLPDGTVIAGVSRTEYSSGQWRDELAKEASKQIDDFDRGEFDEFSTCLHYLAGDIKQPEDFGRIRNWLEENGEPDGVQLFYLATSPNLYPPAVCHLGAAGMADESNGPRRLVVEKPFGTDLDSAHALNGIIHDVFHEEQVYRIDHYLGKETVQNLLVLRFANSIFEPIWNRNYIDHVQITVAEEVPVGDRAGYYDESGILRDMFQNHLLQLMSISAMEAPVRFEADLVRDEKVKVLRAVRPLLGGDFASDTLRGQYQGYLKEKGVPENSQTATFAVLKLHIDNWRWNGVPFYLRSGKAMSCRTTQIVIQFREPPHMLFTPSVSGPMHGNRLVIQVQPAEGIQLHFQTKVPDQGMRLRMADLDFRFRNEFSASLPDAYQRLLLDALNGDASLFARSDEVELAWGIIDPIVAAWQSPAAPPLEQYEPGFWGPESATAWMQEQHRNWFDQCPVL